jgi:hypothetical protein
MWSRPWTVVTVAAGLATSLIVLSCGGAHATAPITPPPAIGPAANLVTVGDVSRTPRGSPQRMVLIWAQAIQFSDPRTVMQTYLPDEVAKVGAARIARAVRRIGPSLGRPQFVQTTLFGARRARVRAFLVSYDSTRRATAHEPVTFDLVRRGTTWRLEDATLLLDTYSDVVRAAGRSAGG